MAPMSAFVIQMQTDLEMWQSEVNISVLASGKWGAVTWKCKKQYCVAWFTAAEEYMALANAAQEAIRMRQLTT